MFKYLAIVPLLLSAQAFAQDIVVQETKVAVMLIRNIPVPALEAGQLSMLNVVEGQDVKLGQELGQIDDEVPKLELARSERELEIAAYQAQNTVDQRFAIASRDVAENELNRSLDSRKVFEKSVSLSEIDRLRLMFQRAELSAEQAAHDMEVARLTKSQKEKEVELYGTLVRRRAITSPLSGRVIEILHREGEWLERGQPIVRIVELTKMRVQALVDGRKHGQELLGSNVVLTVKLPHSDMPMEFSGEIVFVSPELSGVSRTMKVFAEVENPQKLLRAGDRGELKIMRK